MFGGLELVDAAFSKRSTARLAPLSTRTHVLTNTRAQCPLVSWSPCAVFAAADGGADQGGARHMQFKEARLAARVARAARAARRAALTRTSRLVPRRPAFR